MKAPVPALYGVLAEYAGADDLLAAVRQARAAGLERLDAYAPYAVEGLAEALGPVPRGVAPWTLAGGVLGGAGAYGMQWYAAVVSYPVNVGGRPLHSWPAFIPITFELTILGAALAAVVAMLVQNGLPRLVHPLFASPAFDLATRDRYYLVARAGGEAFDAGACRAMLASTAPLLVCEVPR